MFQLLFMWLEKKCSLPLHVAEGDDVVLVTNFTCGIDLLDHGLSLNLRSVIKDNVGDTISSF